MARRSRPRSGKTIALVGPLAVSLACSGLPFFGDPVPLPSELDPEAAAAATAMAQHLVEKRFPSVEVAACDRNGPAFLWLAARSRDPAVIGASLFALSSCAELDRPEGMRGVVSGRLGHTDRWVRQGALEAAAVIVADTPTSDPLVAKLVALATHHDAVVRYESLGVLDERDWEDEPHVAIAFLSALHDTESPWLVTESLRRMRPRAGSLDADAFRPIVFALTMDLDPGIRGRAALVLAALAPEDPDVVDRLLSMLDDSHGYTRSVAGEALADMGYQPAIHRLMPKLQDNGKNVWDMLPFKRLDGTDEVAHHVASPFERVDDAHLLTLERLSAPLGEDAFVRRPIDLEYKDLDLIAAARDARRWYKANGDKIPEE